MATFEYSALTSGGRLMKGTLEASSSEQASEMLGQMQLTVNELQKVRQRKPKTAVGRSEFLLFNQQLASITKAGIPLDKGLRELANDVGSRSMRKLILEIADDLSTAVEMASKFASPGDVVLLSPACASYDMFTNYAQRGDAFTELVEHLDG